MLRVRFLTRATGAFVALAWALLAVAPFPAGAIDDSNAKIHLDLSSLDDRGLYGPPNGLRALHYEFCIPASPLAIEQVTAIDRTATIHPGSSGRSGCGSAAALAIGSTHQADFRTVLLRLASLPFVERIIPCHFE